MQMNPENSIIVAEFSENRPAGSEVSVTHGQQRGHSSDMASNLRRLWSGGSNDRDGLASDHCQQCDYSNASGVPGKKKAVRRRRRWDNVSEAWRRRFGAVRRSPSVDTGLNELSNRQSSSTCACVNTCSCGTGLQNNLLSAGGPIENNRIPVSVEARIRRAAATNGYSAMVLAPNQQGNQNRQMNSSLEIPRISDVSINQTNQRSISPISGANSRPRQSRDRTLACPRSNGFFGCFSPNDSVDSDDETAFPSCERSGLSSGQIASVTGELRMQLSLMTVNDSSRRMIADPYPVHTQVDYTHYLVPDLLRITAAAYYWGIMDRFQAEKLLENKPEGTFLLRDSSQNDYLFSVSFRRYGRTLHARIEQLNHRFSFDSYDPGVFSSPTVSGLLEHYKDPNNCLFFEPLLTNPLSRNFVFSLQHISRSAACDRLHYGDIEKLELPKKIKDYLKEYHYRQAIHVKKFG